MLNLDDSVTWSPLEVPLARLHVFEIYPVTDLEGEWLYVHGLLSSFEVIFIIAWALEAGEEVNLGFFHKIRRMGFLMWLSWVLLYTLQEPD